MYSPDIHRTHIHILTRQVETNIARVIKLARDCKVDFRPHFKTHQSGEVAGWFARAGIKSITVSSLSMARQFVAQGFRDILIAIPFNPAECDDLNRLISESDAEITILLDDPEAAKQIIRQSGKNPGYGIKADTGYGRAGIPVNDHEAFDSMIGLLSAANLEDRFHGLVSHFGHTYSAGSIQKIMDINVSGIRALAEQKKRISQKYGINCPLSIGDTPSLKIYSPELLKDVDEIRPGNFVYFDVMQMLAGHCTTEEIGMVLAAPILARYPQRNEILVHAGAVHLSKESLKRDDRDIFGIPVRIETEDKISVFEKAYVIRLSQEHGMIRFENGIPDDLICGSFIGIIPVHSCLCVSCMKNQD